jgi:PAP2 superfamily protein
MSDVTNRTGATVRIIKGLSTISLLVAAALAAHGAATQSVTSMNALRGLASLSTLGNTSAGKAALASNLTVTSEIQSGAANQPLLLFFPEQQQQALRDTLITDVNAYQLADGLGTTLGDAYHSATRYASTDDATNTSPAIARLIGFANATSHVDSNAAKYFLANETLEGKTPVSAEAMAILKDVNGAEDVFGRAYNLPAGSANADPFGNSRPFQTESQLTEYSGKNFFGVDTTNTAYLRGPMQDLTANPTFPSGHTTYGYMESLLLALLVPERYQQMLTRGAEYGNDRIVLGAHYPMDVLAGRTLAEYDLAQLLADKTGYVGVKRGDVKIDDFREALTAARADMTTVLEKACGGKIAACAAQDQGRFANPAKNSAFYEATQTYGLPVVFTNNSEATEDVAKLVPEAGYLLTAAFPNLTLAQADAILTQTEGPGGGFLDNGSAFGVYSRLDLYKAAEQAAALSAKGK